MPCLPRGGEDGSVLGTSGVFGNTGMRFHIAEVWDLYTVPEARGQGIARRLVGAAIAHCRSVQQVRQVQVSVNASNSPALAIFEATGFTQWGREPRARAISLPDRFDDEIHLVLMLRNE